MAACMLKVGILASTITSVAAGVVQDDLIGSLQARVDLLMAEADELLAGDVTAAPLSARPPMLTPPSAQLDAHIIVPLPARVFFPVQVHNVPSPPPAQQLKLHTVPRQCCIIGHRG